MRCVMAVGAGLLAMAAAPRAADACSCIALESFSGVADGADVAFEGTVVAAEQIEGTIVTTFEVNRYWKGVLGGSIDVISSVPSGGNCGVQFEIGNEALLAISLYDDLCMGQVSSCNLLHGTDTSDLGEGNAPGTGPAILDAPDARACVPDPDAGVPIFPNPVIIGSGDPPLPAPMIDPTQGDTQTSDPPTGDGTDASGSGDPAIRGVDSDDSGCGCRAVGGSGTRGSVAGLLLALLTIIRVRRRSSSG